MLLIIGKKMMHIQKTFILGALSLSAVSCGSNGDGRSSEDTMSDPERRQNQVAQYIERHADEYLFRPEAPRQLPAPSYIWSEREPSSRLPRLTKDYFRCRGTEFNPTRVLSNDKTGPVHLHDCAGIDRHSLPLRGGEEFIYPILIDLLNHLQHETGKRVVITSGHRCPAHNTYVDESTDNTVSKHMIGAAVTFYVQGLEDQPNTVIQHLMTYYQTTEKYRGLKDCATFVRDSGGKQSSSTPAWLNKEIAIRLFNQLEGRNFDNRHPYPYISLTVRYDWDLQEKVGYSWEKAQRNYLRW